MKWLLLFCISFSVWPNKKAGLFWGGFYGDAFGGPYEFQAVTLHPLILKNSVLTKKEWETLAKSVSLVPYRREAHPYGPWKSNALAGTLTDDSRHKWLSLRGLRTGKKLGMAQSYISYFESGFGLSKDWLEEFVGAAYFLTEPNHPKATPPERLWGGIPTVAGQIALLPDALEIRGAPSTIYTEIFALNFWDNSFAKDITAGLVATLSQALNQSMGWREFKLALRANDPYRYGSIPHVPRAMDLAIDRAETWSQSAKGNPSALLEILRKNLVARTWWEADVALTLALSFLEFTQNSPLSALALCREFGQDVDTYAQLVGTILGALHGVELFNREELKVILSRANEEYGDQWIREMLSQENQKAVEL